MCSLSAGQIEPVTLCAVQECDPENVPNLGDNALNLTRKHGA
jgi:hypothetical protein